MRDALSLLEEGDEELLRLVRALKPQKRAPKTIARACQGLQGLQFAASSSLHALHALHALVRFQGSRRCRKRAAVQRESYWIPGPFESMLCHLLSTGVPSKKNFRSRAAVSGVRSTSNCSASRAQEAQQERSQGCLRVEAQPCSAMQPAFKR